MGWLILFLFLFLIVGFFWLMFSVLGMSDGEVDAALSGGRTRRRQRAPNPVSVELTGDYRLEWKDGGETGYGFFVRRVSDGQRLNWRTLPAAEGLESISVAGESHRKREIQSDSFAAGQSVVLLPEPENEYDPDAIAVWDSDQRLQCGYVPADRAKRIGKELEAGEIKRAIVMWEVWKRGQRVSLRLLLLGKDAAVPA